MSGLELFRRMAAGTLPPPPLVSLLGFRLADVEEGHIVFVAEPLEAFYNGAGVVHGGWTAALLDSALGCAVNSMMPAGRVFTTLELKVNLTRPLRREVGEVRCDARVLHVGSRTATAEGRIRRRRRKALRPRHDRPASLIERPGDAAPGPPSAAPRLQEVAAGRQQRSDSYDSGADGTDGPAGRRSRRLAADSSSTGRRVPRSARARRSPRVVDVDSALPARDRRRATHVHDSASVHVRGPHAGHRGTTQIVREFCVDNLAELLPVGRWRFSHDENNQSYRGRCPCHARGSTPAFAGQRSRGASRSGGRGSGQSAAPAAPCRAARAACMRRGAGRTTVLTTLPSLWLLPALFVCLPTVLLHALRPWSELQPVLRLPGLLRTTAIPGVWRLLRRVSATAMAMATAPPAMSPWLRDGPMAVFASICPSVMPRSTPMATTRASSTTSTARCNSLDLEPGPHRIEIRADGFEPVAFDVNVEPGRTITYRTELRH